jgi:hypothetical protein
MLQRTPRSFERCFLGFRGQLSVRACFPTVNSASLPIIYFALERKDSGGLLAIMTVNRQPFVFFPSLNGPNLAIQV